MNYLAKKIKVIAIPEGQTMTEYALILATIAVVIASLYQTAGTEVTELVDKVSALL
ncbi:MAG: hypothetical protein IVW54_07820 [Candidatus Binataceae bacterium]|nr:hypothetical protein [Candidatus Binataceae bacterium]